MRPNALQECYKTPQERPKAPQERPKSAPRAAKSSPRAPQDAPIMPQDHLRTPQEHPREPQEPCESPNQLKFRQIVYNHQKLLKIRQNPSKPPPKKTCKIMKNKGKCMQNSLGLSDDMCRSCFWGGPLFVRSILSKAHQGRQLKASKQTYLRQSDDMCRMFCQLRS